MTNTTLSSLPAAISAPVMKASTAGEDGAISSGGGGAPPTETLSVLSVKRLDGRLWTVEIYVPGVGRRNIVLTAEMVAKGYVPMAAQAVQALYGMV